MSHSFGDNPHKIHGRALSGISQGTSNVQGRRVVRCDGVPGVIDGAHCSYGATVRYEDGTHYYTDSACLFNPGEVIR